MCRLRNGAMIAALLALAISFVPLQTPLHAAVAFVAGQETTCTGSTPTCTFPSAMGASDVVLVARMTSAATNDTPGGTTNAFVTLHDEVLTTFHVYVWCVRGDGSDTNFTITNSGAGGGVVAAAEFSGADLSCTEDGTSTGRIVASTSATHGSTAITTTQTGSLVFGLIRCSTTCNADWTHTGSTTGVPASDTEIASVALGGYQVAGAAGSYTLQWNPSTSEASEIVAAAVKEASAASCPKTLALLGVGC